MRVFLRKGGRIGRREVRVVFKKKLLKKKKRGRGTWTSSAPSSSSSSSSSSAAAPFQRKWLDPSAGPFFSSNTTTTTTTSGSGQASRILASPGVGSISRPLTQRLQSVSTRLPASPTRTHPSPSTRHTTSPTGDPSYKEEILKGVQSGESASRTGQDSEDPALTDPTPAGAAAAAARGRGEADEEGGGLTTTTTHGVNVAAVVPSARPLDQTTDSNTTTTTWDESITPRPPAADSTCDSTPRPQEPPGEEEEAEKQGKEKQEKEQEGEQEKAQEEGDRSQGGAMEKEGSVGRSTVMAEVKVHEEEEEDVVVRVSRTGDERPRPKLTASNSGADIMLGLETEEGQSAEVEIDTADQDELIPEAEVPKGRVRKASITEKVIKTKASEAMAALIKEEAESRQREFEKLLDEHAELVQEISRTPSSENLIQGERDH